MSPVIFESVSVGNTLPELVTKPISRTTLALYAGASGDHNPIHIDIDFARGHGMPDVFAHGMLSMAYLARLLTGWVPQDQIKTFHVRFAAITQLGERIRCTGEVIEKLERDGEQLVRLDIQASGKDGEVKLAGDALIVLP